ncbi:hypothetical protein ES705_28681 [subsurface metagenome]
MKLSSDTELHTLVNSYYIDYGTYGVLLATEGGINEYLEQYWIDYQNETTKVLPAIFFVFDKKTWYESGTMTYAINYPYFNQMNKMQLYRGQNLEYLNHTYFTIVEAYTTLDTRGFNEIPSEFQDVLGNIYLEIVSINDSFRIYDYASALPYSKTAAYYSDQLLELANTLVVIPEFAHISIFLTTTMIIVTLSLYISRRRK